MKYWEIIADNLHDAGWNLDWVSALDVGAGGIIKERLETLSGVVRAGGVAKERSSPVSSVIVAGGVAKERLDAVSEAVSTASNVICIGNAGSNVYNTTWIGNVYNVTPQSSLTAPVVVSDAGQLGIVASSERFKKDIATMNKTSEAILSLRPVTFHYKTDTKGTPQFGLIAEEVAKVNPALVLPDKEGKPFTVRYDAVNAMLLNEFLKEHRNNEEQAATIAQQRKDFDAAIARQQKQIEALTAGLQKVSAEIELSKAAPQTVLNNH